MIDPGERAKTVDGQPDGRPAAADPDRDRVPERDGGVSQDPAEVAMRALRRSLRRPFRVGFVLGGLLAVAAALLVIQNGESARINWLWMEFSAPLWLVLLLTLVAGALVWETAKMAVRRGRRLRRERREALRQLRDGASS